MPFKKISFLILLTLCITSCSQETVNTSPSSGTTATGYTEYLDPETRAILAKDRHKELNSIRKGDYLTIKNNPNEALKYYLAVEEKLPKDIIIKKKIAHAYFLLKDWKNAYAYFVQVPLGELKETEKKEMLATLFFDESQLDRIGEIRKIPLSQDEKEYYSTIDTCYSGIHNCIVTIQAYSGTTESVNLLQKNIIDSKKISEDIQYRNFSLALLFYTNGQYRLVEKLTREILDARPDYAEVIKLHGIALFRLGRYKEAQTELLKYLDTDPKDLEVIAILGEISYALGDYATSNLYLNNAIIAGYTPKANLERKLAYNYALLSDPVGMIKVLSYLLQGPNVTEDDFGVAISLALSQSDLARASSWVSVGLQKFPNSPIIVPLSITVLRLAGEKEQAFAAMNGLPESLRNSPLILLEYGLYYYDLGDDTMAESYFKKVKSIDETADFGIEAQSYIDEIETRRANSGSLAPISS